MKTQITHSFDFSDAGNAEQIQVSGWSVAEPDHTWCVGRRSTLAIPDIRAPHGFFLEIDWYPFVSLPYCPHQSVSIIVHDHQISPYRLTEREIAAFYCPAPSATDKKTLITFEHLDTARVAEYFKTTDPREVAIAFRRVRILPLLEPPPMRIKNMSDIRTSLHDGLISIPGAETTPPMACEKIFSQFEMLAGNCDLGLAARALGFEKLSLLRFAGATADVAIRGLDTEFRGMGEQLTTEIADNPMQEWMVKDAFGLRFHTDQSSQAMSEAEIIKRHRQHIQFLKRKFLEDVLLGEKIFVYADHIRPRPFESALALFLALNRHGKRRMIWVCPNLGDKAGGRVDEVVPGMARGLLDIFDAPLVAGHITLSGWVSVLFNAAMVLNHGTAEPAA